MKSAEISRTMRVVAGVKEHTLKNNRMELRLVPEYGCHWTRLRLSVKGKWVDFLYPASSSEGPSGEPTLKYGSYLLAPWSNRIRGGRFGFEGSEFEVRKNSGDGTAIHGDVRGRPWNVEVANDVFFVATLDSRDFDDFNFPFALTFRQSLELRGDRLLVGLTVKNVDTRRAPVGFGFHPFLQRRLTPADRDVILEVPADKVYPADGCLPTAPAEPVSGALDLTELDFLGTADLDHCFTGLKHPEAEIRLIYPGTRVEVRFLLDPLFSHVVVYAPRDGHGNSEEFVAVEPVTHVNDGFNLHARDWAATGVQLLAPQQEVGGSWELSVGDI